MSDARPIYQDQIFYIPRFEIKLRGQRLRAVVVRDVTEVTYTDGLDRLDSFEFVLHDWDPVRRIPKFSSPNDESGNARTLEDGSTVPNFDPGAQVELYMGYQGVGEPRLMMTGQVVSITPMFPAQGTPTLRVRALSLLYTLQRAHEIGVFHNKKDSEIAQEIGRALNIQVEIPPGQADQEQPNEYVMVNNEYPIIFLLNRARRLGYDLYVKLPEPGQGGDPKLFFGKPEGTSTVYEVTWGRSLMQFSPTVKTRGQIARVQVHGWNPNASGDARAVTGTATIQDINPQMPDMALLRQIDSALTDSFETVLDEPVRDERQANELARGILRERLRELITGRGKTVGLPDLRSGKSLQISGLGPRFSGRYQTTETVHKIDSSGYTTEFSARMEIFNA